MIALDRRYPLIHTLVYGESGSGKSTYFSTYPRPMLIMGFDPYDKMMPYLRLGREAELEASAKKFYDALGIQARDIVDRETGDLIARIEHYADPDPTNPIAMNIFEQRMVDFSQEAPQWGSVGIDSLTYMMRASMVRAQINKPMKLFAAGTDTRQWYGIVKFDMESVLMSRAPWWQTNVAVMCHTKEDKDEFAEGILRGIRAPGTLAKDAPTGFGESHRAYVTKDKSGRHFLLQTRSDNLWFANSLVCQAPDPCEGQYEQLWKNWTHD